MTCANCDKPSHYVYRLTKEVGVHYCPNHLPQFLDKRKRAGLLETTEQWKADRADSLTAISSIPEVAIKAEVEAPKVAKKKAAPKKAE